FTFSNLTDESGVKRSASLYTRIHPNGGSGTYAPTQEVMDMFDDDDKRKAISVDMQGSNRVINKFDGGEVDSDPIIITRLAEMYLIAAEGKGLTGGLSRLNELRKFRGLEPVAPVNDDEFITAILRERRLELLGEGFRWFDLVRTGRLERETKLESQYNKLPIPTREMTLNKLLHQNSYWK
ncbi:MAG: RagB/SusD family nutrient uptake outer membrane protein, partial [Muribaculaceae bacterium]|nr:RagB/SusD family nutrient uptake outer membrane protein [Muribaculaceae bacterium]